MALSASVGLPGTNLDGLITRLDSKPATTAAAPVRRSAELYARTISPESNPARMTFVAAARKIEELEAKVAAIQSLAGSAPKPKASVPVPATKDDEGRVPVDAPAPAPSPDDAWLGDIISNLQAVIEALRTRLPAGDESGEPEARAAATIIATSGRDGSVLHVLKKSIAAKSGRIAYLRDRSPLARTADAFSTATAVARVATALAPTPIAQIPRLAKVHQLRAEIADLDKQIRRSYASDLISRQAVLTRELRAEERLALGKQSTN